ncbi:MAG: Asd/ArgC dimerization domain-containing protein [Myxococcota bacterium]
MATAGFRIGIVGATGALGTELLEVLQSSSIPIAEMVPIATDGSLGNEVEFQGESFSVETEMARLMGLDLVFLCAPAAASLDYIRKALSEQVACIDLSGALSGSDDVPIRVAGYGNVAGDMPLIAVPKGASLSWAMVLQPLVGLGLKRVVGTLLESAAAVGRRGIETLYGESVALFGQTDAPEAGVFERPVAFDLLPGLGECDTDGLVPAERQLVGDLSQLLGRDVRLAVTVVQVPVFVGQGTALSVEFERSVDVAEVSQRLEKAPGVELWNRDRPGPTTRNVAGRDRVVVGRIRADRSAARCIQLWFAADPLRLAASHAVQLATLRLS